ncbi:MAG: CBS domain-containing protein [Desulfomonile tiedjei]|uniref:CBS domain-containing protein n=1 Tax=Desulfomonile tiedjei TaxID=2358 RepID=A0A9D6V309_9BACT|nr:CBS domain-containing protein [Desulfomonile tiedjei]
MYIRNWMLPANVSISSDALATDALMLIRERNLKILPVVDNGRLRGVLHRRDLSEAALCVSGSGDVCEMNYFCKKLKVKDLMVRNPVTVSIDDTVESTLIKGKQMLISSFPVMDGEDVVGMVSDREIYITLFKLLEAGAERTRITLTDVILEKGTLSKILEIVDRTGAKARSIFTVPDEKNNHERVRVVLRLESDQPGAVIQELKNRGYNILESSS